MQYLKCFFGVILQLEFKFYLSNLYLSLIQTFIVQIIEMKLQLELKNNTSKTSKKIMMILY